MRQLSAGTGVEMVVVVTHDNLLSSSQFYCFVEIEIRQTHSAEIEEEEEEAKK